MSSLAILQPHTRHLSAESHSGLKKTLSVVFFMLTLLLFHASNTQADTTIPNEYSVKAALIYSIIKD